MLFLTASAGQAQTQILIGGSVYGGGNMGVVKGNTTVTVRGGDINRVYGGARMADVKGRAFVHLDGEHASMPYTIINYVYGGNDIAGKIGTFKTLLPEALTHATENHVSAEYWNAFVRISAKTITPAEYYTQQEADEYNTEHSLSAGDDGFVTTETVKTPENDPNQKIYIGQLFGGGNGDYSYSNKKENGKYDLTLDGIEYKDIEKPELDRTYLELLGGSIVYAFGGGNNVTVKQNTVIYVNNPTKVVNSIIDPDNQNKYTDASGQLLTNNRTLKGMGLNTATTYPTSGEYQIGSFFGGNNKAEMAIQPEWHLIDGDIRNIYSGGNQGDMTSPLGLLLVIPEGSTIKADNIYGGCRRADVHPKNADGSDVTSVPSPDNYKFPPGLSARVLIRGGEDINNVYGGNDISGSVWGGSAVGIYHSIRGNVYGGGNGSYAYTDNPALETDLTWGDFYYNVKNILGTEAENWTFESTNPSLDNQALSVKALNAHRPNVEQTSVRLWGQDAAHPTVIGGSVYVGGNSATVKPDPTKVNDPKYHPLVELKIGSYVIADEVFLGNNGANMVSTTVYPSDPAKNDPLLKYAGNVTDFDGHSVDFSSLDLTSTDLINNATIFANYMKGAEMTQKPSVVFDAKPGDPDTYKPYSSFFGSVYCGGNRGSMNVSACTEITFAHEIVVFDKLVGGCNDAYIPATAYNAAFDGGLIGNPPTEGDDKGIKLKLNISGLKIQPKRWNDDKTALIWNTVDENGDPTAPITATENYDYEVDEHGEPVQLDYHKSDADDLGRRLNGGNIYGGCYNSGHVNGNVVININSSIIDRDLLFDKVATDNLGEEISLYGTDVLNQQEEYHITERRTGVILGQQGMDVLGKALNVFGGGKGKLTEIWGSTTINLNEGYVFQVFGGSEEGVIGKPDDGSNDITCSFNDRTYKQNDKYSCYINLNGTVPGTSKNGSQGDTGSKMAEAEFIYGGAFLGPVAGNTVINLGNGRIFNSFAGSCNGDILGHTETYIGRGGVDSNGDDIEGFPYIRDYVYGGNDLGGEIKGTKNFVARTRQGETGFPIAIHSADVTTASAYTEYTQGRALGIFGGCFGTYDYTDPKFENYTYTATKDAAGNIQEYSDGANATNLGSAKPLSGFTKPRMDNAFVNFRPMKTDLLMNKENNVVKTIYGGGQGYPGDGDRDIMQNRSYILIDIPQEMKNYRDMEVFGAGAWAGQGMRTKVENKTAAEIEALTADGKAAYEQTLHTVSAIIDLARGQIGSVYGGSFKEGFTRRTVVSVPEGSTIQLGYQTEHETVDEKGNKTTYTVTHGGSLFGGAYGMTNDNVCDVYEANVEYHSENARVFYIYGGNNAARRTLYGRVNIDVPVWTFDPTPTSKWLATVYGAGFGENTWSQYTEVNLKGNDDASIGGAKVYQVFGGGYNGRVMNSQTVTKWAAETDKNYPLGMGSLYTDNGLDNPLVKQTELGDKCNTNVRIYRGATSGYDAITKGGYAYGGGQGTKDIPKSGDVNGSTYIALLGGTAYRDIYAAGTVGAVLDEYGEQLPEGQRFKAIANAYIAGGSVRNVYGGGYMGSVGLHETEEEVNGVLVKKREGDISGSWTNDIFGETNVVIGIREDQTDANLLAAIRAVKGSSETSTALDFYCGVPTVQRNAYGGGEGETYKGGRGGAVFGTANLTLNNGYIGYVHLSENEKQDSHGNIVPAAAGEGLSDRYEAKINDETKFEGEVWKGEGTLKDYGNLFGGGYSDRSNVDFTNVTMWGGVLRGSLHGGAEVAAIGRGATTEDGAKRTLDVIYKPGGTKVTMYNGHVMRNVFGGGKGYNLQGYGGLNELFTDGYVFGTTEVYIHGGEIGTVEGVVVQEDGSGGDGNVFGGGDIGYVYSDGARAEATDSPDHYYYRRGGSSGPLTEDCKVVISPYLQIKKGGTPVTYPKSGDNQKTYYAYDYVPTDYLNTLPKKNSSTGEYDDDGWTNLYTGANKHSTDPYADDKEERGVIIRNAVFGGGNVSTKKETFANAKTVFGNTTATLNDVYHRDFITVGTEHIGGLYGGGNLSLVDGYRELNITNYGTDYYGLNQRITLEEYNKMSNRERAYFQLQYLCKKTNNGYEVGAKISEDEYNALTSCKDKEYWEEFGFCSIYAGRLLNTIQRADFCGVFGSRMVLQGAKDRVPDVADATPYTINRVNELSLNKQRTARTGEGYTDPDEGDDAIHGNYFGIYSYVNYLGNLTSDVNFYEDTRQVLKKVNGKVVTDPNGKEQIEPASDGKIYYDYKKDNPTSKTRNEGCSLNQVALASGVFLELTTEKSTEEKKDYGYITGVIELDLINVKQDIVGGGYVYAKNEHGTRSKNGNFEKVILSPYNKIEGNPVRTHKEDEYSNISDLIEIETSGNFVHRSKTIIDDCYPTNNAFNPNNSPYSEAHYWYIKGSVYVYEQVVSAYTGSANAYSKEVFLPLTITAASNGKLKLLNVQPNKYAYYKEYTDASNNTVMGTGDEIKVNNEVDIYHLNDVISYWDWNLLPSSEQKYFVDQTYVNAITVKVGGENGTEYAPGTIVMLPTEYNSYNQTITYNDATGNPVTVSSGDTDYAVGKKYVFRLSNDISHDTGYVLTFDMKNPKDWDDWFSTRTGTNAKIDKVTYDGLSDDVKLSYLEGPSFRPKEVTTGTYEYTYGQKQHTEGEIITKEVYSLYPAADQGKAAEAYVATEAVTYTYNGLKKTVNKGMAIPSDEYLDDDLDLVRSKFAKAYVCFSTLKLDEEKYITKGDLLTQDDIDDLKDDYATLATKIQDVMTEAYICKEGGKYGGQVYKTNTNYSAIGSWCSINEDEHDKFEFNYDALDLLIDKNYQGHPAYYDEETGNPATPLYSAEKSVEYEATLDVSQKSSVTYTVTDGEESTTYTIDSNNPTISSDIYEKYIANEKRHYTKLPEIDYVAKESFTYEGVLYSAGKSVTKAIYDASLDPDNVGMDIYNNVEMINMAYVAKANFIYKGEPYSIGQTVNKAIYDESQDPDNVGMDIYNKVADVTLDDSKPYYCYENYTNASGITVTAGTMIPDTGTGSYESLPNDQQYFTIQGTQPTETTTFYVSSESDAYNLSKEKIITVVYQYTYNEESEGGGLKTTSELHVVNIHLQMESGVPEIGPLAPPATVLPGETVGMERPTVSEGLYEILTTGWELYASKEDAEHHRNGKPFVNGGTPVYWYQNGHDNMGGYVAFYAQTYLGYTYSKPVPLSVANYHDLKAVMEDKEHHYYIDELGMERAPKIYINDYTTDDPATTQNGLDLLKNLFDLSCSSTDETDETKPLYGHTLLNTNQVGACKNLEFILRTDINHTGTWDGIGTNSTTGCFDGIIHGDGHTISGLTGSLFNYLCGDVYNLGVTGTFTTAGIANEGNGYLENCWVKGAATATSGTKAVFHNPSGTASHTINMVNCYYPSSAGYTAQTGAKGMPDKSFYNGEVAYNLNEFYLFKRYCDHNTSSITGNDYTYLTDEGGETLTPHIDGHYADISGPWLVKDAENHYIPGKGSYVESRYTDGDFIYDAGNEGEIPTKANIRYYTYTDTSTSPATVKTGYAPIWPDDYIFFGQMLTYGHDSNRSYQDLPSVINRDADNGFRLMTGMKIENSNRVYRAPAYYGSSTIGVAHFNLSANFAKTKKDDASVEAYKGMTAIDFTGYQDNTTSNYVCGWANHTEASPYWNENTTSTGQFYPPLLDDDGLIGFKNIDLTKNLLVYTGTAAPAKVATNDKVKAYLGDMAYDDKVTNTTYGTVAPSGDIDKETNLILTENIHGHRVELTEGNYKALNDHLLVDKQDFNAPISYTFNTGKRMWYQRNPDNFVVSEWDENGKRSTKGWEGVSIPFKAEIVTTQTKGELTHFYTTSLKGHEYWLREFKGDVQQVGTSDIYTAKFSAPTANSGDGPKTVTNSFLWDYYYWETTTPHHQDSNNDIYQQPQDGNDYQYYKPGDYNVVNTFENYPRLAAGSPYNIGFPGATYYEFDLSGTFAPTTTADPDPVKLADPQVITFASATGTAIRVSDKETLPGEEYFGGATWGTSPNVYTFMPNYMSKSIDAGAFFLNSDGNSYVKTAAATDAVPFRPYFTATNLAREKTRSIIFNNDDEQLKGVEDRDLRGEEYGSLDIYAKRKKIVVESNLHETTEVRIVNPAGIIVTTFDIEPGETVETRINNAGVYIVQTADSRYTKKLVVK